jgi:CheY-like chemotaxis protein
MPEKEGLETIMDLRKKDASLPIIAISGGGVMSSLEVLDMARSFRAVATLDKPFSGQTTPQDC